MKEDTQEDFIPNHYYRISGTPVNALSESVIMQHAPGGAWLDSRGTDDVAVRSLQVNTGLFFFQRNAPDFPVVELRVSGEDLYLACTCRAEHHALCAHEALLLRAVIRKDDLRAFFDQELRVARLRSAAVEYGLEHEEDLERFFKLEYSNGRAEVKPLQPSLLPLGRDSVDRLLRQLSLAEPPPQPPREPSARSLIVVLRQHKYYKHLVVELFETGPSPGGKVRNPLRQQAPLDLASEVEDVAQARFLTAIYRFQNGAEAVEREAGIKALHIILRNSMNLRFYTHEGDVSSGISARSLKPVNIRTAGKELTIRVRLKSVFYEITAQFRAGGQLYEVADLPLRYGWFFEIGDALYLPDSLQVLNFGVLLRNSEGRLLVHHSKYRQFRHQVLAPLEDLAEVHYEHVQPATPLQLAEQGFNQPNEHIIFLSDFGQYVMLIPVIRYGEVEIEIRRRKNIFSVDSNGHEFMVNRDQQEEDRFTALLLRQHPYFMEQVDNGLHYFYLHKKHFLNEEWFLQAFDEWQSAGITVLGFNEIEGNRLNPNRAKIQIKVLSGINWFNVVVKVRFGRQKVGLNKIYRAVKNRNQYVELDDGTKGILPDEWIERFRRYFQAGEVVDAELLGIARVNFSAVDELFDPDELDDDVRDEVNRIREKLLHFERINEVPVPSKFNGQLRLYQHQGLNWLNFLDELCFGGCLADDMGLGKTVQILAFILLQRSKRGRNSNLIVVPASLVFNWQAEALRFAPDLQVLTLHGAERLKSTANFDEYDIVLTTYGTLLSDVRFLREYTFNYIFLDESQNIKNPESQRYKAARMLQSRNKIAITGTPLENNTFDLFGQLSFTCPGLLGSKQHFKEIYSAPVDQFHDRKRAAELHRKVSPFILRRTKEEVAPELPERTEITLYCEMGHEQRAMYEAYEKEFRELISATTGDELEIGPMHILRGLTRLRQICDSPLLLKGDKLPGEHSSKIAVLMEHLEGQSAGHKVLVFSQFVGMLDLIGQELGKRGISYLSLTGRTRNRSEVVERFQKDEEIQVFLISLRAGGTGLNLTKADYVYLMEPWWNPAVENQAIDRAHRIGQDKKVVAVRMICPGTIEDKMQQLQEGKKELARKLITSGEALINSLTKEELLALLGE